MADKIGRKELLEYYSTHYVPQNLVVSVTGDFEEKTAKKIIKKHFNNFTGKNLSKRKKIIEKLILKNKVAKEKRNTRDSYIIFGFRTVPRTHKDSYALEVLRAVLGRGLSGRIVDEIRGSQEEGIPNSP